VIGLAPAVRSGSAERPAFQWDATRGPGTLTVRLFGGLGERELSRVAETIVQHARAPRDIVLVDVSEVRHFDYRALPGFASTLLRQRDRGASVWLLGASEYIRDLFGIAGEGVALGRLEWNPEGEAAPPRRFPLERDRFAAASGSSRERAAR
jgi:ABC-type transporter Mla MlaB component